MPTMDKAHDLQIPIQLDTLSVCFFISRDLHSSGSAEGSTVPHNHNDFELRYVESGIGGHSVAGESYRLPKGSCLLVHPLEYHWQAWEPKAHASTQYHLRFSVKTPPKNNQRAAEDYQQFMEILCASRCFTDREGRVLSVFRRISDELMRRERGFVQMLRALCAELLVELLRLSGKSPNCFSADGAQGEAYERNRLDSFFRDHYLSPSVKVQHLAEELNVSVRQVNYVLHKIYGKSFVQKITEMRMQQAARLLAFTDRPILAICQSCGFQNQNYFSKCFQREYQVTPTQYRKDAGKAREEAMRRQSAGGTAESR